MCSEKETYVGCLICDSPHEGLHFGVITCRSCAAFFRRNTVSGKQYRCRLENNCLIKEGMSKFCKACRYAKCLRMGMKPKSVQLFRDKIGPRNLDSSNETLKWSTKKIKAESSFDEYDQPSTSSCSANSNSSPFNELKRRSSEPPNSNLDFQCYKLHSELNTKIRFESNSSMLEDLRKGYCGYVRAQKDLHLMLFPHDLTKKAENECREVKYSEYIRMKNASFSPIFSMLNDWFRPFCEQNQQLKEKTLRPFSEHFCLLDEAYRTSKKFPNKSDTRTAFHHGQYIDKNRLENFFTETENRQTKIGLAKTALTSLRYLVNKMNEIEIREVEIAALAGIILWNEFELIAQEGSVSQIREQLYAELHKEIVSIYGRQDVGARIGILISMIHDLDTIAKPINDILTLTKIFNPDIIDSWND